jgi:CRP/FNR family cyclic AMP-dependent transcriptional regulator
LRSSARQSLGIDPQVCSFVPASRSEAFRKKQIIFSVGTPSDTVLFIESGAVKLTVTSEEGREAVLGILGKGYFFGEEALECPPMPRTTNAIAIADVRVVKIERGAMLNLLRLDRTVGDQFRSTLIRLIADLTNELADNLLYASEQRLARALLSLTQPHSGSEFGLIPNLNQQDLANMMGLTRQRVNKMLRRFTELGLICYRDGLRVHHSLRNLAEKK